MTLFLGILGLGLVSFFPVSYLGFYLFKAVLVSLSLGVGFVFLNKRRAWKVLFDDWVRCAVLMFLGLVMAWGLWSDNWLRVSDKGWDLMSWLVYLGIWVLVVLGVGKADKKKILRGVLGVNLLVVGYGFLQMVGLDFFGGLWSSEGFLGRIFSVVGNPNWLASFVVLVGPIGLWILRKKKLWMWALLVLNLVVLMGTASKAGVLAALVVVVTWLLLTRGRRQKIAGFGLVVLVLIVGGISFGQRYLKEVDFGRSMKERVVIWDAAVDAISEKPFGYGMDSFRFVFPRFVEAEIWEYEDVNATIESAHNQLLDLWIQFGVFGVILFLIMLGGVLLRGLKDGSGEGWRFYLGLGILGYFFTNLFGFGVFMNEVVFWFFVGLICLPNVDLKSVHGRGRAGNFLFGMVFILVSLVHVFHLQAVYFYTKSVGYEQVGEFEKSVIYAYRAADKFKYDELILYRGVEAAMSAGDYERAEKWLGEIGALTGGEEIDLQAFWALVSALQGAEKQAELFVNLAEQNNPVGVLTHRLIVDVFEVLDEEEKVIEAKSKLIELLPSYWQQPETEAGRIFHKLNPWAAELLDYRKNL